MKLSVNNVSDSQVNEVQCLCLYVVSGLKSGQISRLYPADDQNTQL